MTLTFRKAQREDAALIHSFICELAAYEKAPEQVEGTPETIEHSLFDLHQAECFFALEDGKEIGFALYCHNFSSWIGRAGLYLEDIYVQPPYRGKGYGTAIFHELARIAKEENCGRMEWVCLNWNQSSIDFYHHLGAVGMTEWTTFRLTEDKIADLAAK